MEATDRTDEKRNRFRIDREGQTGAHPFYVIVFLGLTTTGAGFSKGSGIRRKAFGR